MATPDYLPTVVTALLSGGGAVFIGSVVKSYTSLRGGARARERETISDLATRADLAGERERVAARDRDFWRAVAGQYGYQLRTAGVNPNPQDPVQPSDQIPPGTAPGIR